MRNRLILAVAVGLIATAVPGTWYFTSRPSGDELNATLRSLGYLPVTPPSNLLNLGSLYYVDSDVKFFKTLCAVEKEDLKDAVVESPSASTLADELHSGKYSIGINLDAETVGSGHGDSMLESRDGFFIIPLTLISGTHAEIDRRGPMPQANGSLKGVFG